MTALFRVFHNPGRRQVLPRERRRAALLGLLLAAGSFTFAWSAQEQPAAPPQAPAADTKPAEYVGSVTCQGCHEDVFNAFQKNPHQLVETSKKHGFAEKACESCHGPGSKHAESLAAADIQNPLKMKPAAADRTCLTCHLNQPTHIGRINSSHAKNQVSCVACHSIHKPDPMAAAKPREVNAQCATCHAGVWASFQRPYRHRLPEGAMSCVDCHNPHGTFQRASIRTSQANEPGCYKCHAEKRGPFVYEHAPVKTEGCQMCHQPHGSANPMMLTRAQVRFVCMECHSNLPVLTPPANAGLGTVPPSLHDLRNPRFQNCTLCHQKVHGSNVSRDLFK